MLRRTLLAVLLLPLCAPAAPPDPWLRMQTANFELFTDAGERDGREILKQFERAHSFFELAYGNKRANAKPVCLVAFRSVKEYRPYSPNEVAAAYFQPGNQRDYIVMTSGVTDSARVPIHEYTHLMIHQSGQKLPLWMNEGTAELFSTMEARGPKVLVGNIIPSHLAALNHEQWIDMATLLTTDHASSLYNERDHAGIFYAQSWLLVHMLYLDSYYRPHLREFAAAVQEVGAPAAFQQVYGKSLTGVQDDLYEYFQRKSVNALMFPVELPKSADDPVVQPGATFSIRLALAGLVSDTPKKRDDGRAAYFGLLRDYPDKWEVEAGLAQFYWRDRDGAEAAKHYARALEQGCKDPHAYLEYGIVLDYSRREKEAAAVLRAAIQLDPANQQTHYELGVALTGSGEYQAALTEFKGLQHISRADAARYYYFLAYALYREGQLPESRKVLEQGKPFASTSQEQSNYASLLTALESRSPGTQTLVRAGTKTGEPQLVRRSAPAKEATLSIEGQLTGLDCNGKQATIHLDVNGSEETFVIEDPQKVNIRGVSATGGKVDFQCGPQKNQRLLVEYQESKDAEGKVTRFARVLEFR